MMEFKIPTPLIEFMILFLVVTGSFLLVLGIISLMTFSLYVFLGFVAVSIITTFLLNIGFIAILKFMGYIYKTTRKLSRCLHHINRIYLKIKKEIIKCLP